MYIPCHNRLKMIKGTSGCVEAVCFKLVCLTSTASVKSESDCSHALFISTAKGGSEAASGIASDPLPVAEAALNGWKPFDRDARAFVQRAQYIVMLAAVGDASAATQPG